MRSEQRSDHCYDRRWTTQQAMRPATCRIRTSDRLSSVVIKLVPGKVGTLLKDSTCETCSEQELRAELARVLQSSLFVNSDRLARFLRFAVDAAIAGQGDSLKEYLIGVEVYDRKPPYHPSQDSIVRTEARRLRSKLKEYYEGEGKSDPVFIYFRPGSYLPVFRRNETPADSPWPATSSSDKDFLIDGAGVPVAVL